MGGDPAGIGRPLPAGCVGMVFAPFAILLVNAQVSSCVCEGVHLPADKPSPVCMCTHANVCVACDKRGLQRSIVAQNAHSNEPASIDWLYLERSLHQHLLLDGPAELNGCKGRWKMCVSDGA